MRRPRLLNGRLVRPFDKPGPSHFRPYFRRLRHDALERFGDHTAALGDHDTPLAWLLAWEGVAERDRISA
jgi:hypothetical protein